MADTKKIVFDEAMYNKLIKVLDELEYGLLHKATSSDTIPLDKDFVLMPGSPKWLAAENLLSKGTAFGGSVETQNEALRKGIVKFRNALEAARDVFKETDDLATYDIKTFVQEYPDFNIGGGYSSGPVPTPPK